MDLCVLELVEGIPPGRVGVPETLSMLPGSLLPGASSPLPGFDGLIVGSPTRSASASFWSKVFFVSGVPPVGEVADPLLLFLCSCCGVRGGLPGAWLGDLALW